MAKTIGPREAALREQREKQFSARAVPRPRFGSEDLKVVEAQAPRGKLRKAKKKKGGKR